MAISEHNAKGPGCPSCGACQTCGNRPHPFYPYAPWHGVIPPYRQYPSYIQGGGYTGNSTNPRFGNNS
jgi:hypothetical protein